MNIKELKAKLEECLKMCDEMGGEESEEKEDMEEMEEAPKAKNLSMLKEMAAKKRMPK